VTPLGHVVVLLLQLGQLPLDVAVQLSISVRSLWEHKASEWSEGSSECSPAYLLTVARFFTSRALCR
jgi:hypothetical protein